MLSPDEFREQYPPEELMAEIPESPIDSLRDLQYLYGRLYTLSTTGGGTYAPYLTPDAAGDLVDTDDSLIVVRVDLSGEIPQLAEDNDPVQLTRYADDLVQAVSHCKYSAARGIDHSITHQAGRNSDPEKLARYATERLTKWADDDVVTEAAANHEDGWIVERLAELGRDETVLETIRNGVTDALGGESATALLTVQVKTEPDGDYRWPGDIDVFREAMRQRKLSKLVTKNKATDSSGNATDLVTGRRTRTVGTSEDPLNYYLGKQREKFPGLDVEQAWRSHPISEDAAVTVMNAESFVEACTFRTFGAKVYYLPYFFGRTEPTKVYTLYELLHGAVENDNETTIERAYAKSRAGRLDENELRFYVSAVIPHQMSRYDVFGETMNGQLHYPKQLATVHADVLESSAFVTHTDETPPLPTNDSFALLSDDGQLRSVSTGWYFAQTFATRDDTDADADDPRIDALVNVLSGEPIRVDRLLNEYVARIIEESDDDEFDGFPSFVVASQFAQLCALADGELQLLKPTDRTTEPITREPDYEEHTMRTDEILTTDGGTPLDQKLESFISDTPALAPSEDDSDEQLPPTAQRRGAFLLGALVGEIGNYQDYDLDRSTTLVDQYPVKSITRSRIKKVAQETIGKTITYTREEKKSPDVPSYPGTKAKHIVERLRGTIVRPDPDEWDLGTDDLRFYYALGITYGMNDRYESSATNTEEES